MTPNDLETIAELERRLPADQALGVRALLLGERLHLRGLYEAPLDFMPLVLPVGQAGFAMLFRYGAAVFINLTEAEEKSFLKELKPRIEHAIRKPETEDAKIRVVPAGSIEGTSAEGIGLADFGLPRLQVVAIVLARSVALAQYEKAIAESFDAVEHFARRLEHERTRQKDLQGMLKQMGASLLAQHKMVGRVEIQDKPDLLWDHPELERLYIRLEDEYELVERSAVLEGKLALISRTAETAFNLVHNRRTLRVEWYIVLLIVFEVCLTLFEMFGKR